MRNYSINAYKTLFPRKTLSHGRLLRPEENGDHYLSDQNFFEWWYFDVAFNDGSWLVAVLHSAPYNIGNHKPLVDLRYYPVGKPPIVAMNQFSRKEYEASRSDFYVRIGESWAIKEDQLYHLHIHQGSLEIELSFHPILPSWRIGSGILFSDSSSGHFFNWIVPIPSAHVKGSLKVEGKRLMVTGIGYHDHNWGNVYLSNAFSKWIWGRVWGEKYILLFGQLTAKDGKQRVSSLILWDDGKVLEVPFDFQLKKYRMDNEPADTTETYNLSFKIPTCIKGSLIIKLMKPMDIAHLLALRPWLVPIRRLTEPVFYLTQQRPLIGELIGTLLGKGTYYRWPIKGMLTIADNKIVVQGILERMYFGSRIAGF